MANQEKIAAVAEITERFQGSSAAVLTEYRGLTMSQLTQLRRSLGSDTTYAVVKNTLTKIAAKQAGLELDTLLEGPTAIAFIKGDPVEAAKGLRDFSRTNPLLVIKGGVLDGKVLSPAEIRQLADVEPREVLLARLAGAMNGSLAKAAGLFQAPLSQVARLAAALQEKKGEGATPDAAPATDTDQRRGDHLLRLHRLRRGRDRVGGVPKSRPRPADRDRRVAAHLDGHLRARVRVGRGRRPDQRDGRQRRPARGRPRGGHRPQLGDVAPRARCAGGHHQRHPRAHVRPDQDLLRDVP
jgi:large subunit ribosomal protein L10